MAQRTTQAQVNEQLRSLAHQMNIPENWLVLGHSYEWYTVDIHYVDYNTGELTTGYSRLFTGKLREVSEAIAFMLETNYQIKRNMENMKNVTSSSTTKP